MILSREQILRVSKRVFSTVQVPELEGEVRLVSISAGTQLALRRLNDRRTKGESTESEIMALLLERSIVDEKGDQLLDAESTGLFMSRISIETVNAILGAIPGFSTAAKTAENAPGNSEASPPAS